MDKNAAFQILAATWTVLPAMETFILARQVFVRSSTMEDAERLIHALRGMADISSASLTHATCARISALAAEPIMVRLADTMPSFLDHDRGTASHGQGLNGKLSHFTAVSETAQQLRAILTR